MMPNNWKVYGHDWAVDFLRKGMANQRIRQAYLIVGASSIGKNTLAHQFAMALNCMDEDETARPCGVCRSCKRILSGNHPDILYSQTDPNTGSLKIEEVRRISNLIAKKPYDGRHRIAIFEDFDHARGETQDALLKTLEEPPSYAVLILLAESLESILSTITSRSQIIHLRPIRLDIIHNVLMTQYDLDDEHATLLSRLSGGRMGWAIQAAQNSETLDQREQALNLLENALRMNRSGRFDLAQDLGRDKPSLISLLELWQTYWRDVLLMAEGCEIKLYNADRRVNIEQLTYSVTPRQAYDALNATRTLIDQLQYNTNARLAVEVMFLDYPGLIR
jgi:DNA polymerase-3 subunit delta'